MKINKDVKWYVGGYTLRMSPYSDSTTADWFDVNKEFSSRKAALAYIKDRQKRLNKYGKVGYFTLFSKTSVLYLQGDPVFSKIALEVEED